ncbi:restriction endonuclease subunit S [Ectopseudomonas mendocina]|uniref:Restriction endonuclease subunit S n=1 Tax=Ectopseudomonas mendocina TaxID=300 RepID=A0ABZ2RLE0_ECTME
MVPEGWKIRELGDLAKFTSGGTPSKSNTAYWAGSHPWISGKDLKQHYLASSIDMLSDEGFESTNKAPAGSTLILVRGMTLLKDFPVGFATRPLAFNQDIKALIPEKNVDGLYLSFLLAGNKEKIRQLVTTAGHGTGRLETDSLKSYPLLIPPQLEQVKIAKILSTWDKAITTTEQLLANSRSQKQALMQQLLTGKKRLFDDNGKRFEEEWSYTKFNNLFKVKNKKSAQVKSTNYQESGSTPVVDQGKQLIAGYCNNDDTYSDIPAIVFGDHTRCLKWIDFEFCPGADGTQVLDTKDGFHKKFGYYLLCFKEIPNLGYSRHMRELKESEFRATLDTKEQQKIARVLSVADREIELLEKKLDHLKTEKKALMQQLLTGKRRVKVDKSEVA